METRITTKKGCVKNGIHLLSIQQHRIQSALVQSEIDESIFYAKPFCQTLKLNTAMSYKCTCDGSIWDVLSKDKTIKLRNRSTKMTTTYPLLRFNDMVSKMEYIKIEP